MRFETLQIKSDLLAENTGYGLDNIEHHWKEYNGTSVDYAIDFDSTKHKKQKPLLRIHPRTHSQSRSKSRNAIVKTKRSELFDLGRIV